MLVWVNPIEDGRDRSVLDALLREVLYTVAKSEASSPRLKEIRQLYQLDSLFPRAEQPVVELEMDVERLEAALFEENHGKGIAHGKGGIEAAAESLGQALTRRACASG